ncbi:MAG: M28 family peptidase [Candidatus Thiodiazotropha sp.]|nr:M28 family peptidase [Candidatus Thiodiazotropha taylori]
MIVKLLASISRIAAALAVVIGLLWLILARPGFSSKEIAKHPAHSIDPAVLRRDTSLLSNEMAPRNYQHIDNLNRVADYISESLASSGGRVAEQVFAVDGAEYRNIIAEFGPEAKEIIVVGAHYDVAGEYPGADDNASGVAGLLEIGRLLAKVELQTKVVLVAFTLEEPPFFRSDKMGSAVYAKSLAESGVDVRLMIALEMIGYFTEEKGTQDYPMQLLRLYYPSSGDFIAVVDQLMSTQAQRMKASMTGASDLPVYSINAPSFIPGVDFSDHMNFWRYGYPAVMITDTAFYRNRAYHTDEDRAERLDYERMAQVVYGVFDYVVKLSNGR